MSDTVLFVDDEKNDLNLIDGLFSDIATKILTASSAEEALHLITKEEIAVLVSDNFLPEMKGVDFLSKVREISPDTLKILMTAHKDISTAVDAINNGNAFRFIIKPWDDNTIVQAVHEAINRYKLIQALKREDETALFSLAQTIESKDPYTRGHCERVANYTLMVANALNLSEDIKKDLKFGSWLHDCGKIGVPKYILNKKGPLDVYEFDIIKNHPRWGANVARQAQLPESIIKIILYHHERYDGNGYPSGIKGHDIPLEARIVALADVFDALITDRPYRKRYSEEKAINIIRLMRDNVFDPEIVDTFLNKCLKF